MLIDTREIYNILWVPPRLAEIPPHPRARFRKRAGTGWLPGAGDTKRDHDGHAASSGTQSSFIEVPDIAASASAFEISACGGIDGRAW